LFLRLDVIKIDIEGAELAALRVCTLCLSAINRG
jgi:hypothetical protein